MATVKSFELTGYSGGILLLRTHMKINSFKLAEKRFRTRYEGILLGAWRIDVKLDKKLVHSFALNQLELDLPTPERSKIVPAKEQNSSLSSGVNPCIKAGKEAMKVLERNYSDGVIPMIDTIRGKVVPVKYLWKHEQWHGKGRKPRWLCDYEDSGGKISDIKVDCSECY